MARCGKNSLPGSSDRGSPNGKESAEVIRANLNSQFFQEGESISVTVSTSRDLELSGSIFRIGYYGDKVEGRSSKSIRSSLGGPQLLAPLGMMTMRPWKNGVIFFP